MVTTAKGLLGLVLLLGLCASVVADDFTSRPIRPVTDFLAPDGRFDMNKARESGYQGPLDMQGLALDSTGAATGPLFTAAQTSTNPQDIYWQSVGSNGFPGLVSGWWEQPSFTIYDGKLIVGGGFEFAGHTGAHAIAAWDGSSWSALGAGLEGFVYALTVYNNKLVAGGAFLKTGVDGDSVGSLVEWDGVSWKPFAGVLTKFAWCLMPYNGKLYAAFNEFEPNYHFRVEVWDGTTWSQVGSDFNWTISKLAVFDGKIIAAGEFALAGTDSVSNIAAWDGFRWAPLGAGLNAEVFALLPFDGKLVAAGIFTEADHAPAKGVAAWDGTAWTPMDLPTTDWTCIKALTLHHSELYAGGMYLGLPYIAKWNGASWDQVPCNAYGEWGAQDLISWSDRLVVSGPIYYPGDIVVAWDGTHWEGFGEGFLGSPTIPGPIVMYDGKPVVAGTYVRAGDPIKGPVVEWDGSRWSQLGDGPNGKVTSMFLYKDKLIVSGAFDSVGSSPANHIAAWDGTSWTPLGSGLDSAALGYTIWCNKLIVGGKFVTAGGVNSPYLATWDGTNWLSFADHPDSLVKALTVYNGLLVIGGFFSTIGTQSLKYVAVWDGSSWAPVGSALKGPIRVLSVYNGELVALGEGSVSATWNGKVWRAITNSNEYWRHVNCAVAYNGELMVGGSYGSGPQYLMRWNGSTWNPFYGSGVTGQVWSFASTDSALYMSGGFAYAGNQLLPYLASWRNSQNPAYCCVGTTGNINAADIVDLADLSMLIAYLTVPEPNRPVLPCPEEANVNGAGIVDLADLSMLIAYLTASPQPALPSCP